MTEFFYINVHMTHVHVTDSHQPIVITNIRYNEYFTRQLSHEFNFIIYNSAVIRLLSSSTISPCLVPPLQCHLLLRLLCASEMIT